MTDVATRQPRFHRTRQRLDKASLRWQARLETDGADRVVPWIAAVALFVVLALLALARTRSLTQGVDLGVYTQVSWLLGEGRPPEVTLGEGSHFLAHQAAFLFYPIAYLASFLSIIPTLLLVQSAVLAVGVVPLWRLARRVAALRVGASLVLLVAYALYPAIHNLNLHDFHPEVVALPALLAAVYHGLRRRWLLVVLFCLLAVASRADLALAVAGLGIMFAVKTDNRTERTRGLLLAAGGLAWVVIAVLVAQPAFGDGAYAHVDSFAAYGDTPMSIVGGMITHPFRVVGDLFLEENFAVLVFLLAPVLFLPLLAPRYLLPVVPLEVIYLVADVPEADVFGSQTVAVTAFVFVATTMALAKAGTMGVESIKVDRRLLGALLLASAVFFIRDAESSPYRQPWDWGGRDAVDQARLDAADSIGDDVSVRATPMLVPLLAERQEVYVVDVEGRPHVRRSTEGVEAVILDTSEVPTWTEDERRVFREGLARQGYGRTFSREGVEVYERDE